MSLRSRLKVESKGMFAAFVFYAVVGIAFLVLLPMANFPPHIGIIGIFSLVAAYGLLRKRVWTIWFVIILFFVATTFSALMIYDVLARDYLLGTSMIAYLILTWIFTAYAAGRRRSLTS
jgi:nicotinamide riboside transporter PnuC